MTRQADTAAERAQLLTRCRLVIDAMERAEPGKQWSDLRSVLEASANRVAGLRQIARECAVMAALLPAAVRLDLDEALRAAGIDLNAERSAEAAEVAAIRARGRIRSEHEYRKVQAYADGLVTHDTSDEYLALGALLDEFTSRGAT